MSLGAQSDPEAKPASCEELRSAKLETSMRAVPACSCDLFGEGRGAAGQDTRVRDRGGRGREGNKREG
eukprot:11737223-Alexandrium_andersonii.AAC.1